MLVSGYLLDCYPSFRSGGITFWVQTSDGHAVKLEDREWRARIYARAGAGDADYLSSVSLSSNLVSDIRQIRRRTDVFDRHETDVLELELKNAGNVKRLATFLSKRFHHPDMLQLYNVDFLPEQMYFYEKDLFPLARVDLDVSGDSVREWMLLDNVANYKYGTPVLRAVKLQIKTRDRVPRMDSRLSGITLTLFDSKEEITFDSPNEPQIIKDAIRTIAKYDPDLLITEGGDSFALPFLLGRAKNYGLDQEFLAGINRDDTADYYARSRQLLQRAGKTYFSYGKIMYRPATFRLFGRLHLDEENTFIYDQCRMQGLFEVSRLCRIPLHTSMRASIGKCLSSLQFYYASKQGLLIPWKPEIVEDGKNAYDLFVADRGGMVFKPQESGVYEHIGEIDFSSLYPSIIRKYNISAETVNCSCCPNSKEHWVEELGMHICEKDGIIGRSLVLPLDKRKEYKRLKNIETDPLSREIYNERSASLKWILVCCLAGETPVLVRQAGVIKYVKIGNFIDRLLGEKEGIVDCPDDITVAGVTSGDFRSHFCKVKKLLKIRNSQKLLQITLDDGRQIVSTLNHPFYFLKNGALEVSQASELKEGNFIPVAKKLPAWRHDDNQFIDVIDQLSKSNNPELGRWRVSGAILSQLMIENKQAVLGQSMKEGYSNQAIRMWIKTGVIPLRFFHLLNVPSGLRTSLRVGIGRVKGKRGVTSWMPAIIPINEELGFFLGLYASDGSTTNTYIRFDIGYFEPDLLENIIKTATSLFHVSPRVYKETGVNMYVVQINNLALVKFVEQILDVPRTSEKGKLKVPQIVFNSVNDVANGFLEGLVAGDGSIHKVKNFVTIATASKDFANQIGFLAATMGLGFRISTHPRVSYGPLYTVDFAGPATLKIISQWKYLKKAHSAVLEKKLDNLCNERNLNCTHPVYEMFPTRESNLVLLAREARTVRTPRIDRRGAACPYRVMQMIERISSKKITEKSAIYFEKMKQMFRGDLGFARIRKIEDLDRKDTYVYCFQLADDGMPGFFAGTGAIFTHNCFGYLSYRNAKFGKIDCHIAVCALARQTLVRAMQIAEVNNFRVIHGIVDSLWLYREKATKADYEELCREIKKGTDFEAMPEGIYKWIVFLPSKVVPRTRSITNRYFGCFEDKNEIKVRGIEYRRHDTPHYFKDCQGKILTALAQCNNKKELRDMAVTTGVDIFEEYAQNLEEHEVSPFDLVITRNLSKNPEDYSSKRQLQVNAALKLGNAGLKLQAGQSISYVITRYESKGKNRSNPLEFADEEAYDSRRYVALLADCCASVLDPLGVSKEMLLSRVREKLAKN